MTLGDKAAKGTFMEITGASIIAGSDVIGGGEPWQARSADTGEPFGPQFRDATVDQVARACAEAAAAARAFRAVSLTDRAAFLDACADEIEALGEPLLDVAARESGLPLARLTGERGRTTGQLRLFAEVVRRGIALDVRIDPAQPDRAPLPRPDLRLRMVPLGPVAIFGASNFPLAFSVAGGDTASALAAGCPVVAKAHPAHPGTSELVARALVRAAARTGMPPGVVSLLVGRGTAVGTALVADPRITAVGFTGSRGGGLALVEVAAARPVPIPVYAEMSAVNPVVILPGALADPAALPGLAAAYLASLTNGSGQFCTNPGLLLVPEGEAGDAFVAAIGAAAASAAGQTMLTPEIASAYRSGTAAWLDTDGVQVIASGMAGAGPHAPAPIVVSCSAAAYRAEPTLAGEVFGAAGLVVRWSDATELAALLEGLEGQLTATLHGSAADLPAAAAVLPILEERAGRVVWGGWPTGVEVAHAMVHGGPWPATSAPSTTSVGTLALRRWLRPVSYQGLPAELLATELRDDNPWGVPRLVDGSAEG